VGGRVSGAEFYLPARPRVGDWGQGKKKKISSIKGLQILMLMLSQDENWIPVDVDPLKLNTNQPL
jgi:hypothetical protein